MKTLYRYLSPILALFFAAALGVGAATVIGTSIMTEGDLDVAGNASADAIVATSTLTVGTNLNYYGPGSTLYRILHETGSVDFGIIAANTCVDDTVGSTDGVENSLVFVNRASFIGAATHVLIDARMGGNGNISVRACNVNTVATEALSGDLDFILFDFSDPTLIPE